MTPIRSAVAIRDRSLPSTARLMQIVLAGHSKRGLVQLSTKDLLALTNLDPRTARKSIGVLIERGYLIDAGKAGQRSIYRIQFPAQPTKEAGNEREREDVGNVGRQGHNQPGEVHPDPAR